MLKQQEKWQDAADALREAIRLQPDFAGAHTTLAAVLRQLGDAPGLPRESRAGAAMAKQTTDMQAAVFATNSGTRLLNAGDLDAAISQFRSAIAATPGYAPAHYQLGLALQRKGDREESGRELKESGGTRSAAGAASPRLCSRSGHGMRSHQDQVHRNANPGNPNFST